jgi:hypothetical protein
MPSVLERLISKFDGIGWIPTIRGCLSLDLIDNAKNILGDVDKYSIRFKYPNGLRSEHYLIASSILTTNDTKAGAGYIRTFRYIFTGSINNENVVKAFLEEKNLLCDTNLQNYIHDEGLLIGRLVIEASEKVNTENKRRVFTHRLTENEEKLLRELQKLTELKKGYQNQFSLKAASMAELQKTREEMVEKWKELNGIIKEIEKEESNDRPTFCFEVVLTRDGILLLKDVTSTKYRSYFAESETADDYTKNIPLHRLFKSAMNYMKYLFHSNYHHNEEHDTYLPASNLHSAMAYGKLDLYKVFRHQLDAFLVPIVKLKRNSFSNYAVDPMGIILYAKAFIRVSETNHMVSQDVISKTKEHCEILQREIEQMTSQQRSIINTLVIQHNPFVIVTALLGFVFTCLKTIEALKLKSNQFDFMEKLILPEPYYGIEKFLILATIGYLLYIVPRSMTLQRQFRLKEKRLLFRLKKRLKGLIFRNCVLEKKRFSRWYDLTIYFNSCWMEPNEWLSKRRKKEVEYDYLSIVLYLIIIFLSIAAIAFIVWLLRGYVTNNF